MRQRSDQTGWKGNKAALPSKPCAVCGRPMSWRRAWAKNWEAVRCCSAACRRRAQQSRQAQRPAAQCGGLVGVAAGREPTGKKSAGREPAHAR